MSRNYEEKVRVREMIGGMQYFKQRRQRENSENFG